MKRSIFKTLVFLAVLLITASCGKDDTEPMEKGYNQGVFISCEGAFNGNNGSISWYNPESDEIINNLFLKVNGRPAGDVVQSLTLADEYGVLVANNSGKIEIVEMETFESVAVITELSYPRHFVYAGNGKGYLSNGSAEGEVYKIDLTTASVTDTIEVGMGPEEMVISGNYLFVANSGGWSFDNTVSVIDITTDQVIKVITVGDIPVSVVSCSQGNIWVLCRGKVVYNESWTEIIDETDSRLVRINPATMSVDRDIVTGEKGDGFNPSWLNICPEGNTLYFGEADGLYAMDSDLGTAPDSPLITEYFSYAGKDPASGRIMAVKVTDFSSPGSLNIYEGDELLSTMETGIGPGRIVFVQKK